MDNKNNSGDYNSGYCNSGYCNSGNYNSGYCNSGDCNSGNYNSGDFNSGDCNSGNYNSGDFNSGDYNSGYCNSGYCNSGYCNSGNYNSGYCNSGDYNSGNFNTTNPSTIRVFNKECDMETWDNADKPSWIFNIYPEKWIDIEDMTDKEKLDNENYHITKGYLKKYDYKEAAQLAWKNTTKEDRELTLKLPNFDKYIFFELFGITVNSEQSNESDFCEKTLRELANKLGYKLVKDH